MLRHESVHAFFSPKGIGAVARARQWFGQFAYDNSRVLRFVEEAMAEGYASRSIVAGLKHPFIKDVMGNPLYGITVRGLIGESAALGGVFTAGLYGAYQAGERIFGDDG